MRIVTGTHKKRLPSDLDIVQLNRLLESICEHLNLPDGDIEVTLTSDKEIARLNSQFRQKNTPTNVLSFPQYSWKAPRAIQDEFPCSDEAGMRPLWGEVILSIDTIKKDAVEQQMKFYDELIRICIHGMLHLFGYSHETDNDYNIMAAVEESAISFSKKWIQQQ